MNENGVTVSHPAAVCDSLPVGAVCVSFCVLCKLLRVIDATCIRIFQRTTCRRHWVLVAQMLDKLVFRFMDGPAASESPGTSPTPVNGLQRPCASGMNFAWPLRKEMIDAPTRWYRIKSTMVVWGVWAGARITLSWLNTMRTHNMDAFYDLWKRRGDVPLLTVTNHNSCFDDPGIWGE